MKPDIKLVLTVLVILMPLDCVLAQQTRPTPPPQAKDVLEAYVVAINSNNLENYLGFVTEDVVLLGPNAAPIIGKASVRPWAEAYLAQYKTHWDKKVEELVVSGEWAFQRYSYKSTDTPRSGGDAVIDTGWGLLIYHHDKDGKWRVARDAWGSDRSAK